MSILYWKVLLFFFAPVQPITHKLALNKGRFKRLPKDLMAKGFV